MIIRFAEIVLVLGGGLLVAGATVSGQTVRVVACLSIAPIAGLLLYGVFG